MSLSFYFQFYIETCELGQITFFNEPVDLQLVSNQLQKQSLSQYNQSSFQYDILPYSLASNQTFNMSLILNLSSDSKISAIQNISVNIQITDLYLQIIGGSSLNLGYQNKMVLNTDSRDYEIQDPNQASNINFSWKCNSLSSNDHICYDYQNKQIQLQQGASSIAFPAKTFQPYTIIQFTVVGQKDSRQSNFTTTCIFTELDIPPLNIFTATHINGKINLNDDLNFQINYGENVSSDYLSYAGAILYDNNPVAAIKFDYFQIRFRIWNYFQNIDPSKPTLQIRFSVYNPLYVMPSLSTISIQINIPPQNCVLSINPQKGIALETIFQIQLLSCTDEDLPLTYQFFYYNNADDANQELISPWNILRRQIQDQTINNSIQTILPQGNLVFMVQVMDSYLGVYNTSSTIQVQAQNKSADEYYKLVNQQILQVQQSSNIQITNQLVTLSIIAEDISKNNQFSQQMNDLETLLIQNIQQLSFQIPKFSLLSTFANKVTAQLSQLVFSSSQQSNFTTQKNKIFDQLQTLLQNTNSSIQNSNLSHLQQNNDIQIQNIVDSFKILNSSVSLNSNNSQEDFQQYDKISSQIGNLLNNISLPNQGQIILNGDLSTLLSDKITEKNLFKYVLSTDDYNSENQTSIFSISRNNYKQNIYENTSEFQAYTQKFKNISQNFTYSKNEVISPQIYNYSSQKILNQSTIFYQFNNTNSSKLYNMTCLQQNNLSWSKQNCGITKIAQNRYVCCCASLKPTTIIEDIEDMFSKNKNLQTAFGEQGLLNIASFENFYILLDKQAVQKYSKVHNQELNNQLQNEQIQELRQQQQQIDDDNNQNICENSQMINNDVFQHSPFTHLFKSNENIQPEIQQNQQILSPPDQKIDNQFNRRRKRQKFLNLQTQQIQRNLKIFQEQNIQMKEEKAESNQLQIIKSQSSSKSVEKIKTQTSSQTYIKQVQDEEEIQKINVYLQLSKAKKTIKIHSSLLKNNSHPRIIYTFKKGSIGKTVSLVLQIVISLVYYYVILAVSSGKTPSNSLYPKSCKNLYNIQNFTLFISKAVAKISSLNYLIIIIAQIDPHIYDLESNYRKMSIQRNIMNAASPNNEVNGQINILGKDKWCKDDFELGPCLGKGKFSEVYLAREKLSGFIIALKIMQKNFLKEYGLEDQLRREILLQNGSDHPNILAIYGFFHDQNHIYLILEYAEQGDLYTLTRSFKRIPENLAAKYIKQTISALIFLHKNNVIHRDLKPENILLSKGDVKLGDFGLAIENNNAIKEKRQTFCGTLDYISPEMFNRKGHDFRVDIWSIGVLCYELCSGQPPFESETYDETMRRVCSGSLKFPSYFSGELKELLSKILQKNPDLRPNFEQILQSEWFKIALD
ncbi:Serine/Threonine kinase domain protein (macronuclear) [Tetrahymena thermophila SB210]|uniref:Aurora kinase n=1 Tax=Tetrahymena thermophila (strain SB210) TaxID=312017 RepID=Q235V0_TETTS|nr:Serine/Threonine kinase domain protein [Tetrahymena thermophila SB210]EAR92311.2 Serine/Threonine kinase domain protein [Tetrahymena thermophila SB210]|eukprot:XP_001012556.2 Serine/Threonine kinase domain protein [Tetrahymena thermophila SB210]